jgi:glutaredoxin 3
MKNVTIYLRPTCGFCKKALLVLKRAGVTSPNIIDIAQQPGRKQEMISRSGGRTTVPQIFVDDSYLGECSTIVQLEKEGRLGGYLK